MMWKEERFGGQRVLDKDPGALHMVLGQPLNHSEMGSLSVQRQRGIVKRIRCAIYVHIKCGLQSKCSILVIIAWIVPTQT